MSGFTDRAEAALADPLLKVAIERTAGTAEAMLMRSFSAPSTTPTITPASSSRSVCCAPRASASVSSTAATAPRKAAPVRPSRTTHCVACAEKPKKVSARATPRPAPEALPSRYGSASGLRNRPCATAPANPSSAPAHHAPSVRGSRISHTICQAMSRAAWPAGAR